MEENEVVLTFKREYKEFIELNGDLTYSEWLLANYGYNVLNRKDMSETIKKSLIGEYVEYIIDHNDVPYDEWLLATY